MTTPGPDSLRELVEADLRRWTVDDIRRIVLAHADAWEADRLAGHEWRIEGEELRKRLEATEVAWRLAAKFDDWSLVNALKGTP